MAAGVNASTLNGTPEQIADLMESGSKTERRTASRPTAVFAGRVERLRRSGHSGTAASRIVPHRIRGARYGKISVCRARRPYARTHETFEPGTTSGRDEIKPSP